VEAVAGAFDGVEGFACATGAESERRGFAGGIVCGTDEGVWAAAAGVDPDVAGPAGAGAWGAGADAGLVPVSLSSMTASVASTAPFAEGVVDGGVTTADFAGETGWRDARYVPAPAAPPTATSAISPTATLLLSIP